MSVWMIRVRRFIRHLVKRRVAGGGHIYIVMIYAMIFLAVIFKMSFDTERLYVTYDTVDDSLITALVSSCVCNVTEYGVSDQLVIYRDLTPKKIPSVIESVLGGLGLTPPQTEYDPLNDPEIYLPNGDSYLDNCYEKFLENLIHNLKLDDDMNATISGIDGRVDIHEFSVFNVYRAFDASGNETGYRIVKYTRVDNGNWTVYDYGLNVPASAYSSLEKADVEITETSVAAAITFDVVLSDYSAWLMPDMTEDDVRQTVTYQRVVDITSK